MNNREKIHGKIINMASGTLKTIVECPICVIRFTERMEKKGGGEKVLKEIITEICQIYKKQKFISWVFILEN